VVNPCGFKEVGCANVYIVSLCFGKLRDVMRECVQQLGRHEDEGVNMA
jgi:hypothetical protein